MRFHHDRWNLYHRRTDSAIFVSSQILSLFSPCYYRFTQTTYFLDGCCQVCMCIQVLALCRSQPNSHSTPASFPPRGFSSFLCFVDLRIPHRQELAWACSQYLQTAPCTPVSSFWIHCLSALSSSHLALLRSVVDSGLTVGYCTPSCTLMEQKPVVHILPFCNFVSRWGWLWSWTFWRWCVDFDCPDLKLLQ